MVWFGFKTTASASMIALACLSDAFFRFPFWTSVSSASADVLRFHFFQAMTPVGGLLLLVALGPGRFSYDSHSKTK